MEAADDNFTFVDFLPEVTSQGILTSSTYETFRTLVDRANDFLRINRKWEIVTCESVEFKSVFGTTAHLSMKFTEYSDSGNLYIRGLRLWLTRRNDGQEREQQIGYVNLCPQQLGGGGIFSSPEFETLDSLIGRFNLANRSNPLPGRILNIETQEMKLPHFDNFDPDRCRWTEGRGSYTRFLFVLRIFYESTEVVPEDIGLADFVPDRMGGGGGLFSLPNYEPFSNVMKKASAWLFQQPALRFCNAQTLEIKQKRGQELATLKMSYTELENRNTYYVRILRLAYTTSFAFTGNPRRELTCRIFPPAQLRGGLCPEFENLLLTRQRISAWVKATGARVVSSETVAYRLSSGGERTQGLEASFTYDRSGFNENWIFVIRLYLDGFYQEPPAHLVPPMPTMEAGCCCVS